MEIWDAENQRWHPCDVSAYERTWDTPWMHRVPKAVSLVPTSEPGSWAAHDQSQWEMLENTIGLHYPSGEVEVTVLERDRPMSGARVEVLVWLGNGTGGQAAGATKFVDPMLFSALAGRTDTNGLVRFTLGAACNNPTESAPTFLAIPIGPGWRCTPTPCTAARSGRTAIAPMT